MEENIYRVETTFSRCRYKMGNSSAWEVVGIRVHGIQRHKFTIYKNGILQYTLAQTSLLKQLVLLIPIINYLYRAPFTFLQNGVRCGYGRDRTGVVEQGHYEFCLRNDLYDVMIHSKGVHSLLKNGLQVAVYKRFDDGNYKVRYLQVMDRQPDVLILFAAFVEHFVTLETLTAKDPDAFNIPSDKCIERAQWLPEDDVGKKPFL